jgi:hypothetical protein
MRDPLQNRLCVVLCGSLLAVGCTHSVATGDGGGRDAAAEVGVRCPNLGEVPRPSCVELTEVNPNRVALATVTETISTNSDGYTFTLYDDGSAEGAVSSLSRTGGITRAPCHLPPLVPLVLTCLDWLAQAGDISRIPTFNYCPKSVSFGTRTYITYGGSTSVDLQCIDPAQYTCNNFTYCTSLLNVPAILYNQGRDGGLG